MSTREALIAEARTWLGTRFKHLGRLKGHAADCIAVLRCPAVTVGLPMPPDTPYPECPQTDTLMLDLAEQAFDRIAREDALPGDIVFFFLTRRSFAQHGGLLTDYQEAGERYGILHAYAQAGKVAEHALTGDPWEKRIHSTWRYRGIEE